jgi:hypothetical protein
MIECNPEEEFDILSFQFEMLGVDEVARDISSTVEKSIKQIYSAEGSLTAKDSAEINTALDAIKKYPIHIVDTIGTVQNIIDTISYFVSSNDLAVRKRGIVITLDHSLLVKGDDEKATLDQLYHALVALKMYFASIGVKAMIFVLSQLNRNIESVERVTNPKLHYPNKNDLFGASSVYYSSDYVMVLHKPCLIEGLGNWYGPARKNNPAGLPVFNPKNENQPMIYLHVIKERFGSTRILPMLDELSSARIVDYTK